MKTLIAIVGLAALRKDDYIGGEQDGQQDMFAAQGVGKLAVWLTVFALIFLAAPWLL
jgi:hypothetical protein